MKARITINRDEALKAGLDNEGDYTITFSPADLTPDQRTELALCQTENGAYVVNFSKYSNDLINSLPLVAQANFETLILLVNAKMKNRKSLAIEKKQKAEEKLKSETAHDIERIQKWMSNPDKFIEWSYYHSRHNAKGPEFLNYKPEKYYDQIPGLKEAIEDKDSLLFWVKLDREIGKSLATKCKEKREAIEEAETEAAAQRKTAQITTWVENHGTQSQKDRLKENLLPETEIIDAIRSETYAPLNEWPRYDKLRTSDVCEADDYEYRGHEVDFNVDEKETATEAEFDQLQEIKKLMPNATVELRDHVGECDECETKVHRIGFMVRSSVGEFEFSREYGLKTETD